MSLKENLIIDLMVFYFWENNSPLTDAQTDSHVVICMFVGFFGNNIYKMFDDLSTICIWFNYFTKSVKLNRICNLLNMQLVNFAFLCTMC